MKSQTRLKYSLLAILLLLVTIACQVAGYNISKEGQEQATVQPTMGVIVPLPSDTSEPPTAEPPTIEPPTLEPPTAEPTLEPSATPTLEIIHKDVPPGSVSVGFLVYDVPSKDTAPEKRAPYGDTYKINRFERPFLQDMTYIPDLDIKTYNFLQSGLWTFVSVELIGSDPNNEMGIQYAVEIDKDRDGFGDYLILSKPPFTKEWTTEGVQVWQDQNHDTAGLSSVKSDAPLDGDGYETLLFDRGIGDDPDLAWVRVNAGTRSTVQFAFKRAFPAKNYMLGVIADAGVKDQTKLDYVDRFTEADAGSPIRGNTYYPLNQLWGVDNTCRDAMNFELTGLEPQSCPREEPTGTPRPKTPTPVGCQPPPEDVRTDGQVNLTVIVFPGKSIFSNCR